MSQTQTRLTRTLDSGVTFALGVACTCLIVLVVSNYERHTQDAVSVPRDQLVQLVGMAHYAVMAPYDSSVDSPPTDAQREIMLSLSQLIETDAPEDGWTDLLE